MEPRLMLTGKVSQPPGPEIFAYWWPLMTGKWLPLTRLCGPGELSGVSTMTCVPVILIFKIHCTSGCLHGILGVWRGEMIVSSHPAKASFSLPPSYTIHTSLVKKTNSRCLWHLTTWVSIWASDSVIKANTLWFLSQNLKSILRSVTYALGTGKAAGQRKGRALFCS